MSTARSRAFFHDLRPRRAPFRRQDLAHPAAAGVAAGRADPPLYRRRARALRLADRAVPVLGVPDVRGGQRHRRRSISTAITVRPTSRTAAEPSRRRLRSRSSEAERERAQAGEPADRRDSIAEIADGAATSSQALDGASRQGDCRRAPAGRRSAAAASRWLERPIDKAEQNPELLLYKLQTNAYKFSWALIPLVGAVPVAAVPVQPPLPGSTTTPSS